MEPPASGVRPILKTATKTGTRTRFLADSASKYASYSQSFHYASYSSSSAASASSRSTASSFGSTMLNASSSGDAAARPSSSQASPSASSASRERKRSDEIFLTPGDRRVTFSQFTKTPRKSKAKKALAESRKMTSGFVFSTGGEVEKRKQVRKQQELQMMQKLYLASRKRSLGWKDLLFEQFTVLKDVQAWTQRCVAFFKASPVVALVRRALKQQYRRQQQRYRRSRHNARPRSQSLGAWSAFDRADREYMKRLAQQPQPSRLLLQQASSESTSSSRLSHELHRPPHRIWSDDPVPDLTPVKQGSFSSLLRREGIPVDEDAQREKLAMESDLPGVGPAAFRLKVSPTPSV